MSILLTLAAILLILVVLLQPGKGGGLAGGGSSFGGGMTGQFNTMFGARRTADFLQKFTIYLALGILLVTVITNKLFLPANAVSAQGERKPITAGAKNPAAAPQQVPAQQQPAPTQGTPAPAQGQPAEQQGQ